MIGDTLLNQLLVASWLVAHEMCFWLRYIHGISLTWIDNDASIFLKCRYDLHPHQCDDLRYCRKIFLWLTGGEKVIMCDQSSKGLLKQALKLVYKFLTTCPSQHPWIPSWNVSGRARSQETTFILDLFFKDFRPPPLSESSTLSVKKT